MPSETAKFRLKVVKSRADDDEIRSNNALGVAT